MARFEVLVQSHIMNHDESPLVMFKRDYSASRCGEPYRSVARSSLTSTALALLFFALLFSCLFLGTETIIIGQHLA